MSTDFKDIVIGNLIRQRVSDRDIGMSRICKFLNSTEEEITQMYKSSSLDTETLLRWSKLLEYDFFRLYSQHLILYAPPANSNYNVIKEKQSILPKFRKHIYTFEIIRFLLEQIQTGQKTKKQIIEEYRIPKTTLYKWIDKYDEKK
ncbi:transposase [Chryseobacterium sp. PBS4-4]|uniref:Transposase n=1 Tax=Chryseobacterium edaphi TaxID=2976532 RepID=A0ABT2W0N1_9FLAO|nr:transposase [Chryseobacterium edaphi]MCU7615804.1 transposase [Chryseobacterium edaphi]